MPAQRFTGTSNQTVMSFSGDSAAEVAENVRRFLDKFHVRVVAQSAYIAGGVQDEHFALVTFEPEPV